jgi:predicted RNA-binding Zn ribbon-like protein
VLFADDTTDALRAAVELVNSAEDPDTLTEVAQLEAFVRKHRYTGTRTRDAAELDAVRALRAPLRRLLLGGDRDAAAQLVNEMLAAHAVVPQLARHDGLDYHLHVMDPQSPLADRIAAETAMAMADLIRADELSRISVCADDGCAGVVLDLSRNRSRRYCSTACGNRNAVAAYRARRR